MEVKETLDAKLSEEQGSRTLNQYKIIKELGRGAYGKVHLAYDTEANRDVAIKECSKSKLRKQKQQTDFGQRGRGRGRGVGTMKRVTIRRPAVAAQNSIDLVRSEVAILKKLEHRNIVRLYEVLDDPEQDSLFMVFELCGKGCVINLSMEGKVDPLSSELCRSYFQQLILGIEYLHECDIAHRDIKPDNMLISTDGYLKIVDFGVSEIFAKASPQLSKSAGSPAFYAPEMCGLNKGINAMAADIWAMGVSLYAMSFGYLPFTGQTVIQLFENIMEKSVLYPPDTDPRLVAVLNRLLDKNPTTRISIPELRVDDPWVNDNGNKKLISFEENCKEKEVIVTATDMAAAVKTIGSAVFTVMRAAQKFKHQAGSKGSQSSTAEK